MKLLLTELARLDGIATLRELLRSGVDRDTIWLAARYGRILRIRKGWYGLLDLDQRVLQACRIGGRLGCVSALDFHQPPGQEHRELESPVLHVSVPRGAARLKYSKDDPSIRIHWTRNQTGDRRAVSIGTALAQAARCAGAQGSR